MRRFWHRATTFAVQLSEWAAAGDWRLFFLNRDRVEKVTAADVNRVAAKYLTRNNRTVGVYYPTAKPERASIPTTPNVAKLLEGYKGHSVLAKGESFEPTPENIEKRVVRGELGSIKTAFLAKKTRGEMVEVQLNLRYGNEKSLHGLTTAAQLMPSMLNRGTTKHTRQQIADAFDKLSAHVSFGGQTGLVAVSIKVKKENLAATLALVGEILRDANFPEAEFNVLKRERLARLSAQKTEPTALALTEIQRKLAEYPKDDVRYIPSIEEMIERLQATTLAQVRTVYGMVSSQAGELTAVGDFDANTVVAGLQPALKDWKSGVPYKRIDRPARPVEKGETITIHTPDKANAVYVAGMSLAMNDVDPEYPAMEIGNYLLGGAPLASRLSNRIRGEKGLSYGVQSMFHAGSKDKSAFFEIFAIANPTNLPKVDALVTEEVNKFLKDGLSLEELEAGKKAFIEEMKVERSDDSTLAVELANNLFLGRTFAYTADLEKKIEGLTPAEIQKAYGKILDPKKLVIIHAGDFPKQK